jgi:pimeloyl-ACP methyl ester carboxylesterase
MSKVQVVAVPGSVAPAAQRYQPLIDHTGEVAEFHLKDLEVYREATPAPDYSIDEEVEAINRFADLNDLERFHLVAYSGGGFISLAYAATHPGRVISLGLFEPARIPSPLTIEEREFFEDLERKLDGLTGAEFMARFVREQVKPGVQASPPPVAASPEMQKRPAGIAALIRAFDEYSFDRELFRRAPFPVYYGYGDLSHPEQAVKAGVLSRLFGDIRVQRFAGVHHFVPADQIYIPAHVAALTEMWQRAGESARQLSSK